MKAVILCGGQGTRIRDVSEVLPKPMLPIGGLPILWHIMKIYSAHGVNSFILCLGYKSWKIKEFFLNYREMASDFTMSLGVNEPIVHHGTPPLLDAKITFAETGEAAGTGARLWRVKKYLEGEERFHFTYGDAVADIDFSALLQTQSLLNATGVFTGVRPPSRFGEFAAENGRVSRFHEKPNTTGGSINGGFMVFDNRKVWDYLNDKENLSLESPESMGRMALAGELGVYEHPGFWQCMDTPREYGILNEMWEKQNAPWKVWD